MDFTFTGAEHTKQESNVTDQPNFQNDYPNRPSLLEFVRTYYTPEQKPASGCPLCDAGYATRPGPMPSSYVTEPDGTVRATFTPPLTQKLVEMDFSEIERKMNELTNRYWGQRFPAYTAWRGNPFSGRNLPNPTFRSPGTLRPFREMGVRYRLPSDPGIYQPPHCRRKLSPCTKRKRARLKAEWDKRKAEWDTYVSHITAWMKRTSRPVSALLRGTSKLWTKPDDETLSQWARIDEAVKRVELSRRPCPPEGSQQPQGGEEHAGTEPKGE